MSQLEEWSPDAEEWQNNDEEWSPTEVGANGDAAPKQMSQQDLMQGMTQQHPFLMALAEKLQKHPSLSKAVNVAGQGADVFNKGVTAWGLPNAARGFFQGGSDLFRGLASLTPTGIMPKVNIADPKFSKMPIENVPIFGMQQNPLQQLGDSAGYAASLIGGLMRAPGAVEKAGEIISDIPFSKQAGVRALNKVKDELASRGGQPLKISEETINDIMTNKFLRNTKANRNLLERAKEGKYTDLFDLQSDLGQRERSYTRDIFNAANRQFGRDIGTTRQDLLKEMKQELEKQGHLDLADLLTHGQNRYRQYMQFRPYRNAAIGAGFASSPFYQKIKRLFPN